VLVRAWCWWVQHPKRADTLLAWFLPQRPACVAIQALHALVVDAPTFTLQQGMEPALAIPNPGSGEVTQPHLERCLVLRGALIALGRPVTSKDVTGSPFADLEADLQKLHEFTFLGRL
jgi:hypothetical protein